MTNSVLKIGDQVIEVRPDGLFRETTGTVVKVGRVWATVKFGSGRWVQVDARTLALNGEAYGTMYYTPRGLLVKKARNRIRERCDEIVNALLRKSLPDDAVLRLDLLLGEIVEELNK